MRYGRRIPKITTDDAEILAAINAYEPVTFHFSNNLRISEGESQYAKIGRVKAFKSQYDRLIKENGIKMAEHYRSSRQGWKSKVYGWRLLKSRFGETRVDRYFQGGVRSCDNEEAKEFYNNLSRQAMDEVIAAIDDGDLEKAKKIKRGHVRAGKII